LNSKIATATRHAFLALLLSGLSLAQTVPAPENDAFTSDVAAKLLNQLRAGFEGHMQDQALSVFDLSKMSGGQAFKNQIVSFLDRNSSIRVYFHVREASMENGKGVATVDVEMELEQRDSTAPPERRNAQLRFTAERTGSGWKFTDVQPRSFFS
jgi:hypothetical protein